MSSSEASEITTGQPPQKKRRRSLFIEWDENIQVPAALKKLQKSRLGLSHDDFAALEYQLHTVGAVETKEDTAYSHPAVNVDFKNKVYQKLVRYIPFYTFMKLMIWRHFNRTLSIPPSDMTTIFKEDYSHLDGEETNEIKKRTRMKINDNYELQNCMWTVRQRKALCNSRNHFLRDFKRQEPMLFSLEYNDHTKAAIKLFFIGLLRGEVSAEIMFEIAAEILQCNFLIDMKEKSEDKLLEKVIEHTAIQRGSITVMKDTAEEINAVITLQRFYRKRLNRLRDAVKIIEIWWEPRRKEGESIRRASEVHIQEIVAVAEEENYQQWGKLHNEIKDDYKSLASPTIRSCEFWAKLTVLMIVPLAAAFVVGMLDITLIRQMGNVIVLSLFYAFGMGLLSYLRKKTFWLYFQAFYGTTLYMIITMFFSTFYGPTLNKSYLRILIIMVIIAILKKQWYAGAFFYFILFGILLATTDIVFINAVMTLLFDMNSFLSLVAASRKGSPIKVLYKFSISVFAIFLIVLPNFTSICCGLFTVQGDDILPI